MLNCDCCHTFEFYTHIHSCLRVADGWLLSSMWTVWRYDVDGLMWRALVLTDGIGQFWFLTHLILFTPFLLLLSSPSTPPSVSLIGSLEIVLYWTNLITWSRPFWSFALFRIRIRCYNSRYTESWINHICLVSYWKNCVSILDRPSSHRVWFLSARYIFDLRVYVYDFYLHAIFLTFVSPCMIFICTLYFWPLCRCVWFLSAHFIF